MQTRPSRRQRRAARRQYGERGLDRKAKSIMGRIIELDGRGFEPATIARVVALPEVVVRLALEDKAGEELEGGGGVLVEPPMPGN